MRIASDGGTHWQFERTEVTDSGNKIKEIFLAAVELDANDRVEFLQRSCNYEANCVQKILDLLRIHDQANFLLDLSINEVLAEIEKKYQNEKRES